MDALPTLDDVAMTLADIGDFDGDPKSLRKGKKFATLTRRLEKARQSMKDATGAAWRMEFEDAPRPDATLLDQIAKIPGQSKTVAELRQVDAEFRNF